MSPWDSPDIWSWLHKLPPLDAWKTNSMSIPICSPDSAQPNLNLSISQNLQSSSFIFSVYIDFNLPISLWTSKPFELKSETIELADTVLIPSVLTNLVQDVLRYGAIKSSALELPTQESLHDYQAAFNLAFISLTFLVCIYEAPADLRPTFLYDLKAQLSSPESREALKQLMKLLGSNLEEQWMKSINLGITNWIANLEASNNENQIPPALFSHSLSTSGLWKVQLYCPLAALEAENTTNHSADPKLNFSLNYHQLEGVLQFNYQVAMQETWIDVKVKIDNIRFDVTRLIDETLMNDQGVGASEKHFPSRISLQLTPTLQTEVLSVSVSKSSENPSKEIGLEKSIEAGLDIPTSLGLKISAGENTTVSLKPWKFEESVSGNSANLNWYLHDAGDGREVASSKPSKFSLMHPNAWFKDRYSSPYRPFTRQGGIVFAGDEYGESVWWKMDKSAAGKTMVWEMRGWVWLTYWPNKHKTFYNENRRLEFSETLHLTLS
uniref:Uncharacterized protein n=1 Tax=Kalanchoe fedtschenkoi TaxID=63787 RepID=A0A7N0SXB3_KALFE